MKILSYRKFLKSYSRLAKIQKGQVDAALILFEQNPADPVLRDHVLKGKMKSLRAFSASNDLRVIYREEEGFITVILLNVGTHNQVY